MHITRYDDFLHRWTHLGFSLDQIHEKRDAAKREKTTTGRKICEFLKESGYKYEPGMDSNVFVSFKTGKFESFIPPRNTEGIYKSPQGVYCFDLNMFKKRMFGDGPVSPENFHSSNLTTADDIIKELGFGYGNHGNKVDSSGTTAVGGDLDFPRYMYIVRVKPGSKVLSHLSGRIKVEDPVKKLLRYYSHYMMGDSKSTKFDPKDKRDIGNLSLKEMAAYFRKKSGEFREDMSDWVNYLIDSILKDSKKLHKIVYAFIMNLSTTINKEKKYLRFTLICNSIGIDGFTQRKHDDGFIHGTPDFQTVLLSRKCVDDMIILDLRNDIRNDEYVSMSKNPGALEELEKSSGRRFSDYYNMPKNVDKEKLQMAISFMGKLRQGDFVKITEEKEVLADSGRGYLTMVCRVMEPLDDKGEMSTEGVRFNERYKWSFGDEFKQFGFGSDYKDLHVDFKRPRPEDRPLISPIATSGHSYAYWCYRRKDFEKAGVSWEQYISKLPKTDDTILADGVHMPSGTVFRKFEEIQNVKKNFHEPLYRQPTINTKVLIAFAYGYGSAIDFRAGLYGRVKCPMTLSVYRGDLTRPIKVLRTGLAHELNK